MRSLHRSRYLIIIQRACVSTIVLAVQNYQAVIEKVKRGKSMRAVYIVLLLLMLLFIGVQYNDPDGTLWMVIYAIPAIWAAIAAFRRSWLGHKFAHLCLLVCLFLSVTGIIYYWPKTEGWWRQEVWWEVETAREGMGMMIITVVLIIVWFGRPRSRSIVNDTG